VLKDSTMKRIREKGSDFDLDSRSTARAVMTSSRDGDAVMDLHLHLTQKSVQRVSKEWEEEHVLYQRVRCIIYAFSRMDARYSPLAS
jgi:hypothetical protein